MYTKEKTAFVRLVAMILVVVLFLPIGVRAAEAEIVQPYASSYLDSYGAYVYAAGNSVVRVYFHAYGVGYVDELGALSIKIYESKDNSTWTWKETFMHDSTSGMLSYNDDYHSGYVSYNGVAGRYYKAYVCIWGGEDGDGDTRYFWTSAKKAT